MRILSESDLFEPWAIEKIEEYYSAKYVCESCVKDKKGNWINFPFAIFYTEIAHPRGSHYFGLYYHPVTERLMICDGITATEEFTGLLIDDAVIYSRYRHDYRTYGDIFEDGGKKSRGHVFIDGGRDYLRYGGKRINEAKLITLRIEKDELIIVDA